MICPKCNKKYNSNFDIYSIVHQGNCVECQKEIVKDTGYDARKNLYKVFIQVTEEYKVYASSEEEAREIAEEKFTDSASINNTHVEVTKLKEKILL